jgi:hypothetical protein
MKRNACLVAGLLASGLSAGCVTRSFTITSDPPGMVYVNYKPYHQTPVNVPFIYYGKYHIEIYADGFETLQVDQDVPPPWYQYPGLDFFSENLWPFKLRDNHLFHYQLQPRRQEPQDEALRKGGILRNRGQSIGTAPNGPPPVGPPPPVGLPPAVEPAPPGRPGISGPGA